jgi:hypothetical protein
MQDLMRALEHEQVAIGTPQSIASAATGEPTPMMRFDAAAAAAAAAAASDATPMMRFAPDDRALNWLEGFSNQEVPPPPADLMGSPHVDLKQAGWVGSPVAFTRSDEQVDAADAAAFPALPIAASQYS